MGHLLPPSQVISKKVNDIRAAVTQTIAPIWDAVMSDGGLSGCTTIPGPIRNGSTNVESMDGLKQLTKIGTNSKGRKK